MSQYKKTKLSKLKKGETFRFVGRSKVYGYDGKVRMYNIWGEFKGWGYSFTPHDDWLGGDRQQFKDAAVEINFDY